jgi:alpha-glucosidase
MPFVGSDVCGFGGDTNPQLCTRWHQLGSMYPFSRNHNAYGQTDQEPYRFNTSISEGSTRTYTDVIKSALVNKYSLIQYYYSNFHEVGEFGGSFFKPMFFEFPDDAQCYDDTAVRNNIMLGRALKASINTQDLSKTTTDYYFPTARWC